MGQIPGKVLLIDSEILIHLAVSQVYQNNGPYFITASSPDEAVQKLDLFAFDLILLSLEGQAEQNLALLKTIGRRFPETPVILMAENLQKYDALVAGEGDCCWQQNWQFIQKPFNLDILTVMINSSLIAQQHWGQGGRNQRIHERSSHVETIQLLLNRRDEKQIRSVKATLTDISEGGFGLITKYPLEMFQSVGLNHRAARPSGVVAWSSLMDSHIYRAGIRFC